MTTVASHRILAALVLMGLGVGSAVGFSEHASADPPKEKADDVKAAAKGEPRGESYPITELKLAYDRPNEGHFAIEKLQELDVELAVDDGGYAAPNPGDKTVKVKLKDLGKGETRKIYSSGIIAIYKRLISFLNQQRFVGVFVAVSSSDINPRDQDVRGKRTDMTIIIVTSTVAEVNTEEVAADGAHVEKNAERDAFLRKNSPIKPASEGGPDLLREDKLDDYMLKTSKHENIQIDVTIKGTGKPGTVVLTYLVKRKAGARAGTEPSSQSAK